MSQTPIKDAQTATPDGKVLRTLLPGVELHSSSNIITKSGVTTEFFSKPWGFLDGELAHAIHVSLNAHTVTAWHLHHLQTDYIYAVDGALEVVLYDDRPESPARGQLNVMRLSRYRPEILKIPPQIWHGIKNMTASTSSFINYFDRAYQHSDPDEWRLPWDTDQIPYRF